MTSGLQFIAVGAAAMAGGAVNALAGGGTLITFPVLLAVGFPAVAANVTSTVALCPGYLGATLAQSRDLRGQERRLRLALPAALVGGLLGGLLLLDSDEKAFRALVPPLILLASVLLALQEPLRGRLARRAEPAGPEARPASARWAVLPLGAAAVYGGYFGAGMSVIILAVLGLFLDDTLTRLNALKQAIAFAINIAAAVLFAFSGPVDWPAASVMAAGALLGGAAGGRLAGRIEAATLRRVVVVLGVAIAIAFALGCGSVATDAPPAARAAGLLRTDRAGIEQVWVPAGTFRMGTDAVEIAALVAQGPPRWLAGRFESESPQHDVRLTAGFWIDRCEVTNAAFERFVASGGYGAREHWSAEGWQWLGRQRDATALPARCEGDVADRPRVCITWFEAEAYAHWRGGRLPTEAEWEFAARGPQSRRYPWGGDFDARRCNVLDSDGLLRAGSFPDGASWVGALDMAGNAMEWVADWLAPYGDAPGVAVDPVGPASGRVKVEKGGWWGSNPFVARAAYRHFEDPPDYGDKHIGFRIVSPD